MPLRQKRKRLTILRLYEPSAESMIPQAKTFCKQLTRELDHSLHGQENASLVPLPWIPYPLPKRGQYPL